MVAIIKHRTRLPGKAVKALTMETLKTGYKYLTNGVGKVGHALSGGYRDQRTSCDAFQTLLCNFYDMCGLQQSDILSWTIPIVFWDGLLVKCSSAAQKFASSFSCAVGMEFMSK